MFAFMFETKMFGKLHIYTYYALRVSGTQHILFILYNTLCRCYSRLFSRPPWLLVSLSFENCLYNEPIRACSAAKQTLTDCKTISLELWTFEQYLRDMNRPKTPPPGAWHWDKAATEAAEKYFPPHAEIEPDIRHMVEAIFSTMRTTQAWDTWPTIFGAVLRPNL